MPASLLVVLVIAFPNILTFTYKQALVIVSSLNLRKIWVVLVGTFTLMMKTPLKGSLHFFFFHKIDFFNVTVFVLFSSLFGVGSLCLELLPFR